MSNWKDLHDSLEIETIRKSLKKLTGEYRSLEDFTCQALQLVGDYIDASSLTVSIQDCEQDRGVIDTRLSKQNNIWQCHPAQAVGRQLGNQDIWTGIPFAALS